MGSETTHTQQIQDATTSDRAKEGGVYQYTYPFFTISPKMSVLVNGARLEDMTS